MNTSEKLIRKIYLARTTFRFTSSDENKTPELKAGAFHSPAYRHFIFVYLYEMKKFRIRLNSGSVETSTV
ncbi:hypothetical protein HMPREF0201_01375 [Cedecea davisae DSM 4568]|uniref:Uncharacterized protein n=1 Tax=Cedecea davisae DSM 4568 TaxID=566551 RepID=S3K0H3_9ENTR|nr:hypothetical protein HMPREF0201_01375 [Cedecea davisae DSM 4568]